MTRTRREFLRTATALSAGLAGFARFAAAAPGSRRTRLDLGRLTTDPDGVLDLPEGFNYTTFSKIGETMADGFTVPAAHDGMACFSGARQDQVILVRNHELTAGVGYGPFGSDNTLLDRIDPKLVYDYGHGTTPCRGGTTTLVFDTNKQELITHYLSLAGTSRNCAGGETPWGSWVSCEEDVSLPGQQHEKAHGYCFEVPADENGLVDPVPLKAMGRFNHEAIAVDRASGIVYLTEDRHDSLLYRYIPDEPNKLERGGTLQALSIKGSPSVDTRNWGRYSEFPIGEEIEVHWIDLDEIDAPLDDLRMRGFIGGAARFARGEGMQATEEEIFFTCTAGGPNQAGQVFRYLPSEHEGKKKERLHPGKLELFIEPDHKRLVDMCDNLTVTPWGDLLLCEDGPGGDNLVGVTRRGDIYTFAHNALSASEFAGACFSPDGSTLFVNIQGNGLTLAITGPWPESGRKG